MLFLNCIPSNEFSAHIMIAIYITITIAITIKSILLKVLNSKITYVFTDLISGYHSIIRGLRRYDQGDIADILEDTTCSSSGRPSKKRLRKYYM